MTVMPKKKQAKKTHKTKRKTNKKVVAIHESGKKDYLHAFRCDAELSDLLAGVSNKSEFIVKAVLEQFSREYAVTCPTCEGAGEVFNPPILNKRASRRDRMVTM